MSKWEAIVFSGLLIWIAICLGAIAGAVRELFDQVQRIANIYAMWQLDREVERRNEDE